ncbi:MAG: hypothetical protein ABI597_11980 [Gammaproteobacteria bacterium]
MFNHRPATEEETNLYYAKQAIAYVKKVLPLGSSNKKEDEKKPNYTLALIKLALARTEIKNFLAQAEGMDYWDKLAGQVEILERYEAGNCNEQVKVALQFLGRRGVNDVDLCPFHEGSDHIVLIIGGNVICDPWANETYHVREFKQRQAEAKIDYSDHELRACKLLGKANPPPQYLVGKLHSTITTNETSDAAAIKGEFVRADSTKTECGAGNVLKFSLARFNFLNELKLFNEEEAKISCSGKSREVMYQSNEAIKSLKK